MGGRSGSVTAKHTPIARSGSGNRFSLSKVQLRVIKRCLGTEGRTVHVTGHEVEASNRLEVLGLGTLRDDGPSGPARKSNVDGERWVFEFARDASLEQG